MNSGQPDHRYQPSPGLMRATNARSVETYKACMEVRDLEPEGLEFFIEALRRVLDRVEASGAE